MTTIVPKTTSSSKHTNDEAINHANNREKLLENLLAASKSCHIRFGGRMELATDTDQCVMRLCYAFESIFRHGLRYSSIDKLNSALRHMSDLVSGSTSRCNVTFWPCIKEQLTWHEQERFSILKNVHTEYGRGRAWLRAALNERCLERHLHSIINPESLTQFYEKWAFILDQDKASVLPNVAAGLATIVFAIPIDNDQLDNTTEIDDTEKCLASQSEPIISSGIVESISESNHDKVKKKVQAHIISFDNDDDKQGKIFNKGITSLTSVPSTCFSSSLINMNSDSLISPTPGLQLSSPLTLSSPSPSTTSSSSSSSSSSSASASVLASASSSSSSVDKNVSSYSLKSEKFDRHKSNDEERILTPLTDIGNIGGLLPVSPLDQTLDDILVTLPNYTDVNTSETADDAIEAVESLVELESHVDTDKLDIPSLRIRILAMSEVLEQAREDAVTSRLQLARLQRQHQNYLERHEVQLQAINRENELLRQQLRKYVTAVQMLKRDSNIENIPDEEHSRDYYNEAQQYQEKLIQVAEMHAELMEFNARLTVQLLNREKYIKQLRAELECLRGPLNEDDVMSTDTPCLIHIWIPSAFLTGHSSDIHHVYQIYIRVMDIEWNIYRRYAQFHALYRELKKHDAVITTFDFPPKKTIGNKDAKFVEDRRQKLQQWLRRIVGRLAQCSPAFTLRPSKQTLIALMPFFGDYPTNKGSTKANSAQDNLSSSSSQYMGL